LSDRPASRLRTALEWGFGLALIGVGVVGAFVPILQGWVFVLAGLAILSRHSRWARAILNRVKSWGRVVRDRLKARRGV